MVREGRVFISALGTGKPAFGSNYYVQALEVGAQVTVGSSGTTVTVAAGHGFAAGDKYMKSLDASTYSGVSTVVSVTATSLTLDSALSVSDGDILINLGADTGSTSPNYDGNGVVIYSDMDFTTAVTNATVTTDSNGRYTYYHKGDSIWELVRSTTGLLALYKNPYLDPIMVKDGNFITYLTAGIGSDIGITSGSGSHGGLFITKPTTSTGATGISWCRSGVENWALGEDAYTGTLSYWALWNRYGTTGTSGDIFGVSWYGAEGDATHGSTGGTSVPKWFFNSTPFGQYDSAWTFNFHGASTSGGKRSALFQDSSYATTNGGVDVYFAGNPINGLELRNEDGTNYRSTIRFCRTTTAGGGTINGAYVLGMGIGTGAATFQLYDEINSSTRYFVSAAGSSLWSNASGTYTPTYVFDFLSEGTTVNAPVNSFAIRYRASTGTPAIGLGLYQAFRVPDAAGTDTRAGSVGVVVTSATAGSLKAMTQLWSSYGTAAVLNVTDARKVLINTTSETNATAITIALDADSHAAITMAASTATPANPSSSSEGRIYVKGGKFVIQYNDGGTVRWKYLDLTGTGVTWTHVTAAP